MLSQTFNLKGKIALVTGSSQGIGEGIALAMAEYGADIVLHYRSDADEAEAVAQKVRALGRSAWSVQGDLSKAHDVTRIFQQLHVLGKNPDILVLNASVQIPKTWQKVSCEDIDTQMNANFKSSLLLIQGLVPAMEARRWGRILTIGSVQQVKPHPAMIVYAASKSAVLNMVQNLGMQLAGTGITINNLAPGVIGTPRLEQDVPPIPERIEKKMETPLGGPGEPEDCAAMAVLLCSEAGRFITGQNIFVDGGLSL